MVWEDSFKRVVATVQVSQTRYLTFMRIILIDCPIFHEIDQNYWFNIWFIDLSFFLILLKVYKSLVFC